MSKKDRIWCKYCCKWFIHNFKDCPMFPGIIGIQKWTTCVCLIHTCDDRYKDLTKLEIQKRKDDPTNIYGD